MQHMLDRQAPGFSAPRKPAAPRLMRRPGGAGPRVAIIHYWLVGMRGGEKVLESLLRMFPEAEIFTHAYDPSKVSELIRSKTVHLTSVGRLPFSTRLYQNYLTRMPRALEEIDLSGFDLVLSSESGPAKGVIPAPDALHLCYTHSPMRYLWDQYHVYHAAAGPLKRALMPRMVHELRKWDVTSAARVDAFMANSTHVQARINKYWRRDARVVHPPVAVDDFAPATAAERGGFYLWAGELAGYKRPDIAIEAFNRLGKPLYVIGGPDKTAKALAATANENIRFLGRVPFEKLKAYMAACKALVFPGEEDFGLVPVEAMAAGRPVIAMARGGVLDTVVHGRTGLLYEQADAEGLMAAVEAFEAERYDDLDPATLTAHARQFDEGNFRRGIASVLRENGMAVNMAEVAGD
ncbi:glycosyltransferase [Maritimibacter sp. UBA3975]|uniref:glycosyltransferase n=1 Tax=Maritimibacter sp. UBA3975 TaxID=1946833 RepID=UPI000C09F63D|nr:glycosyltransferase [Maritimibacter sp. UBA3975]MAM63148.1 glycosyl transferase [Maritimibacter sp.]